MTYEEIRNNARKFSDLCKFCPVCDGKVCKNTVPGPGAKGSGTSAIRNYEAWQNIYLNMDTISQDVPVDTSVKLFGQKFNLPVFAAPMGAVGEHFTNCLPQAEYDDQLIKGCTEAGIAAFTGDGLHDEYFPDACAAICKYGQGVPTIKPWSKDRVFERIDIAKKHGVKILSMDIDGSGLPFLKNMNPPSGSKSVEELREIIEYADVPFVIKGIMTAAGARKAAEAGAAGIVVSNHGGRVLDHTPATAWVLPEIVKSVGDQVTVLVDGGIRTGLDVFKALALGADGVLIGRPFAACVYGGGAEGVKTYIEKLGSELVDAMQMCGPRSISEINNNHIWIP